jgi:hypothetical protein
MIKDSGDRTEFSSGAVRDKGNKGDCSLLPFMTLAMVYQNDRYGMTGSMDAYYRFGRILPLIDSLKAFMLGEFGSEETAILELSIHYQEGAQKYEARNWEKGIPISSFVDSAMRHYFKHMRGDKDERHDRAFMWNIVGLLWTRQNHPEMDDYTIKESES